MLSVTFRNDGTGDAETGYYDVVVTVNGIVISRERIEGHRRADGWRELVRMLAEKGQPGEGDE